MSRRTVSRWRRALCVGTGGHDPRPLPWPSVVRLVCVRCRTVTR